MVPVFLFLISIPSCTYIFETLLRIRDPSVFIPFSEAETKRGACRCAIDAFSFPIGKFIRPPPRHAFPISVSFLFTIRFSRRPSGSETAVPRRDLFEWFSSQSGPLVKFLLASTFFASLLPLLLRHPLPPPPPPLPPVPVPVPGLSLRPIRIPLTDLGSKADSHGRSDPLCTFQKCLGAAPGVNETRR